VEKCRNLFIYNYNGLTDKRQSSIESDKQYYGKPT